MAAMIEELSQWEKTRVWAEARRREYEDQASALDAVDRDALERCMDMARRDPSRARQMDSMLTDQAWLEVATFASYVVQGQNLRLKPWESPPMCGGPTPGRTGPAAESDIKAGQLLDRMLAAGLSQYEPDPIAALKGTR
jgi:hypothetical protein